MLSQSHVTRSGQEVSEDEAELARKLSMSRSIQGIRENWHSVARMLLQNPRFVNKNGQPLQMIPKLELDPALLEQPLYH